MRPSQFTARGSFRYASTSSSPLASARSSSRLRRSTSQTHAGRHARDRSMRMPNSTAISVAAATAAENWPAFMAATRAASIFSTNDCRVMAVRSRAAAAAARSCDHCSAFISATLPLIVVFARVRVGGGPAAGQQLRKSFAPRVLERWHDICRPCGLSRATALSCDSQKPVSAFLGAAGTQAA
jgi:hypothetical protein